MDVDVGQDSCMKPEPENSSVCWLPAQPRSPRGAAEAEQPTAERPIFRESVDSEAPSVHSDSRARSDSSADEDSSDTEGETVVHDADETGSDGDAPGEPFTGVDETLDVRAAKALEEGLRDRLMKEASNPENVQSSTKLRFVKRWPHLQDETLIHAGNASFKENMLLVWPGRFYVCFEHACFHCGHSKKMTVVRPYSDLAAIRRTRNGFIIVLLSGEERRYNCDNPKTIDLLFDAWRLYQLRQCVGRANPHGVPSASNSTVQSDEEPVASSDGSTCIGALPPTDSDSPSPDAAPSPQAGENDEDAYVCHEPFTDGFIAKIKMKTPIENEDLPATPVQVFNRLMRDDAFSKRISAMGGTTLNVVEPWERRPERGTGFFRGVTGVVKMSSPTLAGCETGSLTQTERIHLTPSRLVLESTIQVLGPRYSDCFTVETHWEIVAADKPNTSLLTMSFGVNWSSSPFAKGMMESQIAKNTISNYKTWVTAARTELLTTAASAGIVAAASASSSPVAPAVALPRRRAPSGAVASATKPAAGSAPGPDSVKAHRRHLSSSLHDATVAARNSLFHVLEFVPVHSEVSGILLGFLLFALFLLSSPMDVAVALLALYVGFALGAAYGGKKQRAAFQN